MRKFVSALLATMLLFSSVPSFGIAKTPATVSSAPIVSAANSSGKINYIPDNVIIKFKTIPTTEGITSFASRNGITTKEINRSVDKKQLVVKVPKGKNIDSFMSQLKTDTTIASVDKNYIRQVQVTVPPNDVDYNSSSTYQIGNPAVTYTNGRSWWLRNSGVNTFWSNYNNVSTNFPARATSDVIKVGVIDTGFYMNHPDKGSNIVAGKDEFQTYSYGVTTKDNDVTPASETAPNNNRNTAAHGTCVAGEIAAATNNSIGVASVGYDLQVRVYKVQGIWTEGDLANGYPAGSAVIMDSAVVDAIYDATNDGVKVLNMSLGGPGSSTALQDAINYAYSHGVVIVAATGNDGVTTNFYPAAANNVIGVGSYELDASGNKVRSSFSNYGSQLDVLAPGAMIYGLTNPTYDYDGSSTSYQPGYEWWQGTSMASPAFAGMLAMVWRFAPGLSNAEITNYMLSSATAVGTQPNTNYGYGYANVAAAYSKLKTDFPYLAKPTITTVKTAYGTENVNLVWNAVAGRNVQYQLSLDGGNATTISATNQIYSSLTEGNHSVVVTPISTYNWWSTTNAATFSFTVDKTAPVVSNISYDSNQITWTDTEGTNPHTTQVYLGTNAPQSITGNVYNITPGSLADGTYVFHIIETDAVGNVSTTYNYTFNYVNPPAVPVLNTTYTSYETNPYTITWVADPTADYQYILNGGAITNIPDGSVTLSLVEGANTLRVRSIKGTVTSSWTDTTITFYPPLPSVPSIPAIADVSGSTNSKTFSWNAASYATSYEYRLNGGTIQTTTGTSGTVTGLVEGNNTVQVRSKNLSGYSTSWASATITYYPPAPASPTMPATLGPVNTPSISFSWSAVTYATGYEYRLNGGTPVSVAGTSANVTGLNEGSNTIDIRSKNFTGYSTWSAARTVIYNPPLPAAPAISAIPDVFVSNVSFSWAPVNYATSYEYRLGTGGTINTTANSTAALTGLSEGINVVQVRSKNYSGYSAWTSSNVTYYPPVPAMPTLSAVANTTVPTQTFNWNSISYATSYEYRINGGTTTNTTNASVTLNNLVKGSNTFEVRSKNFSGVSNWSSRTFTFTPPVPDAPVISATSSEAAGPLANITLTPPTYATAYRYELNGIISSTTTANLPIIVNGLVTGPNTIRVRAINSYGDEGSWSNYVTVTRIVVYDVAVTTSTTSVTYGGSGAAISVVVKGDAGQLLNGKTVAYRYSYTNSANLADWGTLATLTTGVDGKTVYTLKPKNSVTYIRPVIAASPGYPEALGAVIKISNYPYLSTPSSSSTVYHSRSFTVSGYIKPHQKNHSQTVKLKFYRYKNGAYVYYKTVTTTNHDYSSYSKYSVSTSVPYSGKWRVYAYYIGSTAYAAKTTSSYKSITAK